MFKRVYFDNYTETEIDKYNTLYTIKAKCCRRGLYYHYTVRAYVSEISPKWIAEIDYCGVSYRIHGESTNVVDIFVRIRRIIRFYSRKDGYLRSKRGGMSISNGGICADI